MSHSPEDLDLELRRLGRFFDLQLHLTVKPLEASEVRGLASFVLRPHFLLQGALEGAIWLDRSFNLNALLMRHGSSASDRAVGLFQITNAAGGLEGKLVLLEELEASESEVLREVRVPVRGYQGD